MKITEVPDGMKLGLLSVLRLEIGQNFLTQHEASPFVNHWETAMLVRPRYEDIQAWATQPSEGLYKVFS